MNANLVNLESQHLNEDHRKVYFSIQSIVWSHYELLSKFRMHSRLFVTRVKMCGNCSKSSKSKISTLLMALLLKNV